MKQSSRTIAVALVVVLVLLIAGLVAFRFFAIRNMGSASIVPEGLHDSDEPDDYDLYVVPPKVWPPKQKVAKEFLSESAKPVISEFMADNRTAYEYSTRTYEDWIEICNPSTKKINLKGYYLTDDKEELTKWKLPESEIEPGDFIVFWADGRFVLEDGDPGSGVASRFLDNVVWKKSNAYFHAPFKLDAKGEYLALVATDGKTVIHEYGPTYPKQYRDLSYGLVNLGKVADPKPGFLAEPTPQSANAVELEGCMPAVELSVKHGFFDDEFDLTLRCTDSQAEIRFTLDGSVPTRHSDVYEKPIKIGKTTVLRASAFRDRYVPSLPQTATYLFVNDVAVATDKPAGYPREGSVNGQLLRFGMDRSVVNKYSVEKIAESLKAIPSVCISTSSANLFSPQLGIYANSLSKGIIWERPASFELINPDGTEGLQVEAGVRIRGGVSRGQYNLKHAMRLVFRERYGASKLKFPLFGDEGTDEFKHIDFRTSLNYSWATGHSIDNNMLRDVFSRDCQRDMGQPYTRSRYYHLYLNGLYWGVYQTQERAVAGYAESYFGGKSKDYDVVKAKGEIPDGNNKAFLRFYKQVQQGVSSHADYMRLQGMNPDGTPNEKYEKFLDAENLIDYMLITYYTGDRDGPGAPHIDWPNNYYSIYNRKNPDGWKYFEHDSEHSLDVGENDMTCHVKPLKKECYFNPHWLHDQLVKNQSYLKDLQKRYELHFGAGGALTYASSLARLEKREQELAGAIYAHAARWGDTQLDYQCWEKAVKRSKNWLNGRGAIVYGQMQKHDWLTSPATPPEPLRDVRMVPSTESLTQPGQ